MIQKLKNILLTLIMLPLISVPTLALTLSGTASAACGNIANQVSTGANDAAGGDGLDCNTEGNASNTSIKTISSNIVNTFSIIVGAVSVIMIIYGGFRYITSGGDSGRVGNAKNTLIYAIVGLIIVALAQIIVHFVLNRTSSVLG